MARARAAPEKENAAGFTQGRIPTAVHVQRLGGTVVIQALTVSCSTCGEQTMSDTKKCDNCREVETRLAQYLFDGGTAARAFVWAELVKAEEKAEERANR
jgi:hypothetical protein